MASVQYDYQVYNNQPHNHGYTQDKLDKRTADGWHVYTAGLAFAEVYILWETAAEGADPLYYQIGVYNFQHAAEAREKLRAMIADGWHVHTANLNHPEAYILWEKGGSALANRLTPHIVSNITGQQPAPENMQNVEVTAGQPEVPVTTVTVQTGEPAAAPSATDALFGAVPPG